MIYNFLKEHLLYCVNQSIQALPISVMPSGYATSGVPTSQTSTMLTGQPVGNNYLSGNMQGMPASDFSQLTQQNITEPVTTAFQAVPLTQTYVMTSKETLH